MDRASKYFFQILSLALFFVLARSLYHYGRYTSDIFSVALAFIVPALALVASIMVSRLRTEARSNLLLLCLSIAIPLYGIEFYLGYHPQDSRKKAQAITKEFTLKRGDEYDGRTQEEVIIEERAKGIDVLSPLSTLGSPFTHDKTGPTFIRKSVSNRVVIGGNESGKYLLYESDEYGFKNPKGIWGRPKVSLMAVGDSFTFGVSVPSEKDIVGVIRNKLPYSLNLGVGGIGPVFYYQNLLEYGSILRPDHVLFIWFEGNDVTDLLEEEKTPTLAKYIGRKERFGLFELRDEINQFLLNNTVEISDSKWPIYIERMRQFFMLYNVRKMLGLGAAGSRHPIIMDIINKKFGGKNENGSYPPLSGETLRKLLGTAKDVVSAWGGKLYFVYLPAWQRYCNHMDGVESYCEPLNHNYRRDEVLDVVKGLNIETVDMHEAFSAFPDPGGLFFFPGSHYSPDGYRLVAETVLARIRASGG